MTEAEKSLELAKLCGWNGQIYDDEHWAGSRCYISYVKNNSRHNIHFNPYRKNEFGLAQFAAVLLKFPEVMAKMCSYDAVDNVIELTEGHCEANELQENILDEVLKLHGVDVCFMRKPWLNEPGYFEKLWPNG